MSRTYKDRGKRRRIVKNSLYKKVLRIWGEDFSSKKGKKRILSKLLRRRLEREKWD